MRLKTKISTGLVGLVGLTGCVDLTENIVSGVTASYFETAAGLEDAVDATYSYLQQHYGLERSMTMLEMGTDLWTKGADGGHKQWNDYTPLLEPRTAFAQQQWEQSYAAINTANAVINRAQDISTGISQEQKDQRIAEARFLRAFYYFYLVRHYGDLHISLEETQGVQTEATRSPVAEVYSKVIIPDLEAAIATLPAVQSQYGRVTKGAAQHTLGLVYLTRLDPGDAARAEPLLRAVATSPLYKLEQDYEKLWCGSRSPAVPCTIPTNERNPEYIFTVQYTDDPLTTGTGNQWHVYYLMEYDIQTAMTRSTTYGRPFKRLRVTDYFLDLHDRDKDERYEDSFQHVWLANKGDAKAGIAIGDTSIFIPDVKTSQLPDVYKGKKYTVVTRPDDFWNPKRSNPVPGFPNVKSEYSTNMFPSLVKWMAPNRSSTNEIRSERDFPVFRLADTYLLLAESLIRQGKNAEAVEWVNRVRERAGKPGKEAEMRVGLAEMNLDFILEERARELFGEGHRWFDLKRFGKLVEYVKERDLDAAPNIQPFHVLRPIPQEQIDRTTTDFPQNPGYN